MYKFKLFMVMLMTMLFMMACQPAAEEPGVDTEPTSETSNVPTPEAEAEMPEEEVELVIWNTWSDHHVEAFQEILDAFNSEHENITVVQQSQPLTDYESKLMQAVRQGVGPDLITTFPTVAANYIDDGLIVNLNDYVSDPEIGMPGFEESLSSGVYQEITQWDGDIYMIPMFVGGEVFYYNKTLFDELGLEVPTTWQELETVGRTIYEETGQPAFGFDSEIDGFQVLIMQNGSGYINPETAQVEYNNEVAVEQLEWFCGLVEEGVFRLVGEDVYFSNPFGSQAVASYAGSAAGYGFVASAVDGQFEFDVAPMPQTQDGAREYISSWGSGWIIFKSDEAKQRAAFEFVKYMSSPEVLGQWGVDFGGVPAYQEAIEQPVFQEYMESNPAIAAQREQIHRVGHLSAIEGSAAIRTVIGRAVTSTCTGLTSAADALQQAETEGNAELAAGR